MHVNQHRFPCQVTLAVQYDILTPEGSNTPRFKEHHHVPTTYTFLYRQLRQNTQNYCFFKLKTVEEPMFPTE